MLQSGKPGSSDATKAAVVGKNESFSNRDSSAAGGAAKKQTMYAKLLSQAAPMLWPEERHLQFRVFTCIALLAVSRVANFMLPYTYKLAVDFLGEYVAGKQKAAGAPGVSPVDGAAEEQLRAEAPEISAWSRMARLVASYVLVKGFLGMQGDLRNFIFTPVAQATRSRVQLRVLFHLHSLSHRYHLGRKTGTILQVVERGTASLQSLLTLSAFYVLPSLLDMAVCITLFAARGQRLLAAVTAVTITIYLVTTAVVAEWRITFRQDMIAAENKAKQRAVESLTNFETVKVCPPHTNRTRLVNLPVLTRHAASIVPRCAARRTSSRKCTGARSRRTTAPNSARSGRSWHLTVRSSRSWQPASSPPCSPRPRACCGAA